MNTPITDAAKFTIGFDGHGAEVVPADLARQLERDRARMVQFLNDAGPEGVSTMAIEALLASLEIKE